MKLKLVKWILEDTFLLWTHFDHKNYFHQPTAFLKFEMISLLLHQWHLKSEEPLRQVEENVGKSCRVFDVMIFDVITSKPTKVIIVIN